MNQREPVVQNVLRVCKALAVSYALTAICLFVVAALLLKWNLTEEMIQIGMIVTDVLSSFVGGMILGKIMGNRKFAWGILLGILYFGVTVLLSLLVYHGITSDFSCLAGTCLLCAGGGMAGGMIS